MPSFELEEVLAPFINARSLVNKPPKTPKELLEDRLNKRILTIKQNIDAYLKSVKTYENELEVFLSEVENCMTEDEVRRLCSKHGL